MASLTSYTTTFPGSSLPSFLTAVAGGATISVTGGQLVIAGTGSEHYCHTPTSGDTWATSDIIYCKLPSAPTSGTGRAQFVLNAEGHYYQWTYGFGASTHIEAYIVDTSTQAYEADFNATTHKYVGFKRTASGVELLSSTDASSWTTRGSHTVTLSTGEAWFYLAQNSPSGTAYFDAVNDTDSGGGSSYTDPYGVVLRDALVGTIEPLATTGVLKLYNHASPDSGTVLASLTLPADNFSAVSSSAITKNGTWSGTASASGTPLSWRLFKSDGVTLVHQGSAGYTGSGAALILDNGGGSSAIVSGDTVTITTWTYTAPTGS